MRVFTELSQNSEQPVITVSGRLTGTDSDRFGPRIGELLGLDVTATTEEVRIDISQLDFVDSSGLGLIVRLHNDVKAGGGKLIILNSNTDPSHYVRSLLDMTGLKRVLNFQ